MNKSKMIIMLCISSWLSLLWSCDNKPDIEWICIPAGTFTMGSPPSEEMILDDEQQHKVRISRFRISRHEITVRQFSAFIDATGYVTDAEKGIGPGSGSVTWTDTDLDLNPGVNWRCDEKGVLLPESDYDRPVIFVSWNDARAFAEWMGCRLPTEAEWEYACRAGTSTTFNTGSELKTSDANYFGLFPYNYYDSSGTFIGHPVPAGSFKPNKLGLFDMHGNVSEWCSDWYGDYPLKRQKDPSGPEYGLSRVVRGGSWCTDGIDCRSASRSCHQAWFRRYDIGFRVVAL